MPSSLLVGGKIAVCWCVLIRRGGVAFAVMAMVGIFVATLAMRVALTRRCRRVLH